MAQSTSGVERKLLDQMRAARRIYTDMEILARLAIDALATSCRSARLSGHTGSQDGGPDKSFNVHLLEEEYRAKVVELESKMSSAQLQASQLAFRNSLGKELPEHKQ